MFKSPRKVSLLIALLAASLTGGVAFLSFRFSSLLFVPFLVLMLLLEFVGVFMLVNHWLFDVVFYKINPLYRTIQEYNLSEKELREKVEQQETIENVNREVLAWARNRADEIAQLKQLEKYRREFLGNVSHELKTPIFSIQGYILTLLDGGLEDSEINRLYLEKTEKSINRMISIVEDLESISRLESGELKLQYEEFNIVALVKEVFDLQEILTSKLKIKLKFAESYDKPIWVYADKKRITEVLNNLVVNAIKYGKPDGCVVVTFFEMGKNILVEVEDNGIGIASRDVSRIFERFYRVDKSRSREQGGTGLGLAIVKHIIEAHEQKINVRSTLGKGTTFSFTIEKA
jgi:two-component system, OmpR family, phosphate regulon sensor histidine kinase PhoR